MFSLIQNHTPQTLADLHSSYYRSVVEEPFHPVRGEINYATGCGPNVKTRSTPCVPERFVETLRAQGIKARVKHYRWVDGEFGAELARISKHERKERRDEMIENDHIFQNGGETFVCVTLPDGREAEGIAVCSQADLYNKRLGVYLATKRALAILKPKKDKVQAP